MLSIVLKILSILGILLLCLLGLVTVLLLLALFFPISYRLAGKKDTGQMTASAGISWLFGFLRVSFDYPEPGKILVKVLPLTVFDSGKKAGDKVPKAFDGSKERKKKKNSKKEQQTSGTEQSAADAEQKPAEAVSKQDISKAAKSPGAGAANREQNSAEADGASSENTETADTSSDRPDDGETGDTNDFSISKKFKKIKYTILSIYDKIKNIWENISCYMELFQEEETKLLFSHVIFRLGKILKSIRPRHIRGQILFGTGAPDTTGYAYGVYGMLSPFLGSRLLVTPDFTRPVLEGNIYISGHITVFTIIWNGLKILLDKNLRRFIKKMKAGRKK